MSNITIENLTEAVKIAKKSIQKFCSDWSIKGIIKVENQIRFSESQIDINKNWNEIKLELFLSQKRRTMDISMSDLNPKVIESTLKSCEKLLNIAKLNTNYKRLAEASCWFFFLRNYSIFFRK